MFFAARMSEYSLYTNDQTPWTSNVFVFVAPIRAQISRNRCLNKCVGVYMFCDRSPPGGPTQKRKISWITLSGSSRSRRNTRRTSRWHDCLCPSFQSCNWHCFEQYHGPKQAEQLRHRPEGQLPTPKHTTQSASTPGMAN